MSCPSGNGLAIFMFFSHKLQNSFAFGIENSSAWPYGMLTGVSWFPLIIILFPPECLMTINLNLMSATSHNFCIADVLSTISPTNVQNTLT